MRRILVISSIVAVVVVLFVWLFMRKPPQEPDEPVATAPRTPVTGPAVDLPPEQELQKPIGDDDGDGVRNWEETLWGTNPQSRDTDGDGRNDGEEIQERREASVVRPGGTPPQSANQPYTPPPMEPQTPSDTPVAAPPTQAQTIGPAPTVTESPEVHAFGNALGEAIGPTLTTTFITEQDELQEKTVGLGSLESANLKGLKPLGEAYKKVADSLKTITPPPGGTVVLKDLTDGYVGLSNALLEIAKGDVEREAVSRHWQEYSDAMITLAKAAGNLVVFFVEHEAAFQAGEPGAIFTTQLQ